MLIIYNGHTVYVEGEEKKQIQTLVLRRGLSKSLLDWEKVEADVKLVS